VFRGGAYVAGTGIVAGTADTAFWIEVDCGGVTGAVGLGAALVAGVASAAGARTSWESGTAGVGNSGIDVLPAEAAFCVEIDFGGAATVGLDIERIGTAAGSTVRCGGRGSVGSAFAV
jgi:hypothetical protein